MSTFPQPFDIAAATQEMKNIDTELLRLRTFSVKLKQRKTEIEKKIQTYLSENNHKGVVIDDVTILAESQKKNKKLSKKEQDEKMLIVLRQHGLSDTVLSELQKATQGTPVIENKLTINYNKK